MSGEFEPAIGARVWLGEMLFAGIDAVAICLPRDGRVLAVERVEAPGVLCMPGGKVERSDRTIRDAARRELFEETGIRLHAKCFEWLGAVEVPSSRREQPRGVAVYLVSVPAKPDERRCEPGMRPRWHELDDLCDVAKHGRFARAAMLARWRLADQRLNGNRRAIASV
jgi:8-oxo-dGTP pyrophosphatase MutT (NUDIX family)